ncbi:hypothetical protein AMTR_s00045p00179580 [Amborella trichopoda]|uniref:Uncharacterized protein n=1 Tax=Amborella trichopoda TaxID=13333 RepID=W1P2J7_AMBTC|nr:hypothetical protein AMTR_s00045p00179580 [Amborella trichopoda]
MDTIKLGATAGFLCTQKQLATAGYVDPSVNFGRNMRTNDLQFMHNAGLGGGEMRSNDSRNMFDAASMIHKTPTITASILPRGITTLHIAPPTLANPNFKVPTSGAHGYAYSCSGFGDRAQSSHANSYHITHPGSDRVQSSHADNYHITHLGSDRVQSSHASSNHITHPGSGAHAAYGGSRAHSSGPNCAGCDHKNYDNGALTAYNSWAHQADYRGELSNNENRLVPSYHKMEAGNRGDSNGLNSMPGIKGNFYNNNSDHTIYINGAHQAYYSGAPSNNEGSPSNNGNHFMPEDPRVEEGNKGGLYRQNPMIRRHGDRSSQNSMIGSNGDLCSQNHVIPLLESGSVDCQFVEGGSFGLPHSDSLDDILSFGLPHIDSLDNILSIFDQGDEFVLQDTTHHGTSLEDFWISQEDF